MHHCESYTFPDPSNTRLNLETFSRDSLSVATSSRRESVTLIRLEKRQTRIPTPPSLLRMRISLAFRSSNKRRLDFMDSRSTFRFTGPD